VIDKRKARVAKDLHEPVSAKNLEVTLEQSGGDSEKMIKRFLKKVRLDGILQLTVKRSSFIKKSEAKRMKSAAARRNLE